MTSYFLKKADENLPKIYERTVKVDVTTAPLGNSDSFIVDLGNHYVGYFSFMLWFVSDYIDAPVRMAVRFCEQERELDDDYGDYHGTLCASWLQEEIINVDFPGEYKMPRRYAARFIRLKILNTPKKLSLSNFSFKAVSSANDGRQKHYEIADAELRKIDKIAVNTLRNCMQRVFEDGPKRDRRLWIGDLRLEALTSYYTFENPALVRRCLYLFAASKRNEYGIMPGFVYENPVFASGNWFIIDYSLQFVCTLCDLCLNSDDENTFRDLYGVAKSILDVMDETKDEYGLVTTRSGSSFVDWCEGLRKNSSLEGIYLYTLELWCQTLEAMGMNEECATYRERLDKGRISSFSHLYDKASGKFINERDGYQYSVHTAAWMVLGGVVEGEEAKRVILDAITSRDSVKPFTPYMHHYAVEALFKAKAEREGEEYIRCIWGAMARTGADTFQEVFAPDDPNFSPYGDRMINSCCHAWSCTPAYFIRKYGLGNGEK